MSSDPTEIISTIETIEKECKEFRDKLIQRLDAGEDPSIVAKEISVDSKIKEIRGALKEGRLLRLTAISGQCDVCDLEVASMRLEVVFEETLIILYNLKDKVLKF